MVSPEGGPLTRLWKAIVGLGRKSVNEIAEAGSSCVAHSPLNLAALLCLAGAIISRVPEIIYGACASGCGVVDVGVGSFRECPRSWRSPGRWGSTFKPERGNDKRCRQVCQLGPVGGASAWEPLFCGQSSDGCRQPAL